MTARTQAYRRYRATASPRVLDRRLRNRRGGWRRQDADQTLALLIEDGSWPIDLTALAQRRRALGRREREERAHRLAAAVVLLLGLAGLALFLARGLV